MIWIERDCSQRILDAVKTRPSLLLTGMRQAGKSSLLKTLFPDANYITLDDIMLAREANEKPNFFLGKLAKNKRVIIDEIQYAPGLFRELKILIDEEREVKGRWLLTGSQNFSLMNQVCESLAGRIAIIELSTLSARELIKQEIFFGVDELIKRGGFPELWKERELDADTFYGDYLKTYIERDVRSMLKIGDLLSFQRFIQLLAMRSANLLNLSELARDAAIAPNTAKAWCSVLESSGVILLIPPFFENIGKRLIKTPKLFFTDNGLLLHLLRIRFESDIWSMPNIGQIWENFVISEIAKTVPEKPGQGLFYYRDSNGVEIDALIIRDRKIFAIEAKSAERPDEKKLHFSKVLPLFEKKGYKTTAIVAAPISQGRIMLDKWSYVNPGLATIVP